MNDKIRYIFEQIRLLEEEIQTELVEQRNLLFYEIHGRRVEFERSIKQAHQKLKQGIFRWFLSVRPQNYITAPFIYGMIFPILALVIFIMLYQLTCFPIYGISKVKRSDYFSFDHHLLAYLNVIEKFNCLYCSYGNGLIAYATEVFARTEQYFCPIKHARRVLSMHARYQYFLDYGEAADLHKKLEVIRNSLISETEKSRQL